MGNGKTAGRIHPVPTRRSKYRYQFYVKHHGQGGPGVATWLPDLSPEDEFFIFDEADFHNTCDDRGWLYGIRRSPYGELLEVGTWGQLMATFPVARQNEAWHGFPLWPLKRGSRPNLKGENRRPARDVFLRMQEVKLLTLRERRRLMKGNHL